MKKNWLLAVNSDPNLKNDLQVNILQRLLMKRETAFDHVSTESQLINDGKY